MLAAPPQTLPQSSKPRRDTGPNTRKKRQHTKVRSGCVTCKQRRVKCDESKPTCLECKRGGRVCQGYQVEEARLVVLSRGTTNELRSLQYYHERTINTICGLFEDQFWRNIILQASDTEPALKHALVALASINESAHTGSLIQQRLAWQQCNIAIRLLTSRKNVPRPTLLVASALFMYLEILQNHISSAMAHLRSAFQLLASPGNEEFDEELLSFYHDIYYDHGIIVGPHTSATNSSIRITDLGQVSNPQVHSTPEQVKTALFLILQKRQIPSNTAELIHIVQEQRELLTDWAKRIEVSTLNLESRIACWSLKALGLVSLPVFHTFYAMEECVTDRYIPEFTLALEACIAIYEYEISQRSLGKASTWAPYRPLQSVLSCLALHCRDPTIRRNALAIMKDLFSEQLATGRRVPIDSNIYICDLIIQVEESSCNAPVFKASDVPETARVRLSSTHRLTGSSGSWIRWVRYPYIDDGPYEEAWLSWTPVEQSDIAADDIPTVAWLPSTKPMVRFYNALKMSIWRVGLMYPQLDMYDSMVTATNWGATNFSVPLSLPASQSGSPMAGMISNASSSPQSTTIHDQ